MCYKSYSSAGKAVICQLEGHGLTPGFPRPCVKVSLGKTLNPKFLTHMSIGL